MYTIPKKLMKDIVVHMERLRRRWRLSYKIQSEVFLRRIAFHP